MLRSVNSFTGFNIAAKDGEIGFLESLHFDSSSWKVKYLVTDIVDFFSSQRVLLVPTDAYDLSWLDESIKIDLSKEQIKSAKPYSSDLPVSDQHELLRDRNLNSLYLAEPWSGSILPLWIPQLHRNDDKVLTEIGDPDLRCTKAIKGRRVKASDKEAGVVKDFIVDTDTWMIKFLVIDTNGILPFGDVLMATHHVSAWAEDDTALEINFSSQDLEACPKYDPNEPVNREYVLKLYDYEGKFIRSESSSDNFEKLDASIK